MTEQTYDIKCCGCKCITRDIPETRRRGYFTVRSGFVKSAADSCDNCGHDFCDACKRIYPERIA